jgi:subtilase family serine protease
VAPGAKVLYVGARDCAEGIDEAINWVVQHKPATIVSNSYVYRGENLPAAQIQKTHSLLVQAAAEGIGFTFASGDSGDETVNGLPAQPDYPASDPLATAVGGTSLAVDQTGARQFETGWGTAVNRVVSGAYPLPQPGTFTAGSGGGTSTLFAQPDYQRRKVPSALSRRYGDAPMRVSPDVAAAADPYTGFVVGQTVAGQFGLSTTGGTELACSLFAGIEALASTHRPTPIGFANPLLYSLKAAAFHDILPSRVPLGAATPDGSALVTFDRDSSLSTTYGYDAVTGLGTPGPGFVAALGG